jgi:hypothetical protein
MAARQCCMEGSFQPLMPRPPPSIGMRDVEVEEEGLAAGAAELDALPVERGESGSDKQEEGEEAHQRHCIAARV